MDVDTVTAAIAGNTRAWRLRKGWSLDALATRAGVSRGMLVQVEQGRTNPSIATLCRLADALGLSLSGLVEPGESHAVRVVPGDRAAALWRGDGGGEGRLRLGLDPPVQVELWEWRLEPGERYDSEQHPPGSRELIAVHEGTLVLDVDGRETSVPAGDAALLLADRPHSYLAGGAERCTYTMVYALATPPAEEAREARTALGLQLRLLPEAYAVSRLPAGSALPADTGAGTFFSVTRGADEVSVVSTEAAAPAGATVEPGWRAFRVAGPLAFSLTGVLAGLTAPLAEAGIAVFAHSTYDTDYLMVRSADTDRAADVLVAYGHQVTRPEPAGPGRTAPRREVR